MMGFSGFAIGEVVDEQQQDNNEGDGSSSSGYGDHNTVTELLQAVNEKNARILQLQQELATANHAAAASVEQLQAVIQMLGAVTTTTKEEPSSAEAAAGVSAFDGLTLDMSAIDIFEDEAVANGESLVLLNKQANQCAIAYNGSPSSSSKYHSVVILPKINFSIVDQFYWKVTIDTLPRNGMVFIGTIQSFGFNCDDTTIGPQSWKYHGSYGWRNYYLPYEGGRRNARNSKTFNENNFVEGDCLLFKFEANSLMMYSTLRQEHFLIYIGGIAMAEHYIHLNFTTRGTKLVLEPMNKEERKLMNGDLMITPYSE